MEPLLCLENVEKSFPGVKALKGVSFEIQRGEILGLVGENGAGKSTLIKAIGGALAPDSGNIKLEGQIVSFKTPNHALSRGISVVHQELSLCENLSVAENIYVKELMNSRNRAGLKVMNYDRQCYKTEAMLKLFELEIDPRTKVVDLSLAEREQVEILRAIAYKPRLLILDEPTGPLSLPVVEKLFNLLHEIKSSGTSILYISHEISEITELCDRVAVLRDGEFVTTLNKSEMENTKIANLMVGRDLGEMFPEKCKKAEEKVALEVCNYSNAGYFNNISFKLRKGEILGVSGLIGAGRTELALSIFGMLPNAVGDIYINERKAAVKNPKHAMSLGLGYLTEDRKKLGLFLKFSIEENMLSIDVDKYSKNKIVSPVRLKKKVDEYMNKYEIKANDGSTMVGTLSGGNQQKILLSKVVSMEPEILIVDEPTRGIDIGAKKAIHQHIQNMADSGKSIILISSEMTEIIGMSDRIMIMDNGKFVEIIDNSADVTQELVMNKIVSFKDRESRCENRE